MKVLTGSQIREADRRTLEKQQIPSHQLMERAALYITQFLTERYDSLTEFMILTGKGDNGGDGLCVARMLSERDYACSVITLYPEEECSEDYRVNLGRLPEEVQVSPFSVEHPPVPASDTIIIDALLGVGVRGAAREPVASAIRWMNECGCEIVSIDMPSGMPTESGDKDVPIVQADITLTLQFPKLSLLMPDFGEHAGEIEVLSIRLDESYMNEAESPYYFVTYQDIKRLIPKRPKFAHKGQEGHALLVAGSKGMAGAAVLATEGALRSGCGLITVHLPEAEHSVIHISHPAVLVSADNGSRFTEVPFDLNKFSAIGIGCGIGQAPETFKAFKELLEKYDRPMVIDADALNILAARKELLPLIPADSILTPHVGELRRLIGTWEDDHEKLKRTSELAASIRSYIVIKGAHTTVCSPDGRYWFNSTGNAGMAKGGSGDVLAGLMTGLLAKGTDSCSAAILAVYVHGRAGDDAAAVWGKESMNAEDIAKNLTRID